MSIEQFKTQQIKAFFKKAKEKGRPLNPWKTSDKFQLSSRIEKELIELKTALHDHKNENYFGNIQDECYDLANTAWCIWERIEQLKENKNKEKAD